VTGGDCRFQGLTTSIVESIRHLSLNRTFIVVLMFGAAARTAPLAAQRALTLEEAVRMALASGPGAGLARADSLGARAGIVTARAFPDPVVSAGYTRDTPRYHAELEQSLDMFGPRGARIRAAGMAAQATTVGIEVARARVRHDVTVAYASAVAAARRLDLAERALRDADELVRIARARRDAGDASDLDVGIAELAAGGERNQLSADSIAVESALIELRLLLGGSIQESTISPSDSLETLVTLAVPRAATPVRVMLAEAELRAREAQLSFERRSRFPAPSLRAGFDAYDPTTGDNAALPTIGLSFPLPFWDHNRGGIAMATAEATRASIALDIARRESVAAIARAERAREAATRRVAQDRELVANAERLAGLVTTAYGEGAYPLASVIDAQRTVRETLTRYIDDLESLVLATASIRLETTGVPQ
jgi:outer membrane protein, heavy metal efflux system